LFALLRSVTNSFSKIQRLSTSEKVFSYRWNRGWINLGGGLLQGPMMWADHLQEVKASKQFVAKQYF